MDIYSFEQHNGQMVTSVSAFRIKIQSWPWLTAFAMCKKVLCQLLYLSTDANHWQHLTLCCTEPVCRRCLYFVYPHIRMKYLVQPRNSSVLFLSNLRNTYYLSHTLSSFASCCYLWFSESKIIWTTSIISTLDTHPRSFCTKGMKTSFWYYLNVRPVLLGLIMFTLITLSKRSASISGWVFVLAECFYTCCQITFIPGTYLIDYGQVWFSRHINLPLRPWQYIALWTEYNHVFSDHRARFVIFST